MNNNWKRYFFISLGLFIVMTVISVTLFGSLSRTKTTLRNTQEELTSTENQLTTTKQTLADSLALLDTTSKQLTTKEAELTLAYTQLATTKVELANTSSQLTTVKNEKNQLLDSYASLLTKINLRFGDTALDRETFVTPSDTAVTTKVNQITTEYNGDNSKLWSDYLTLYRWVTNNIDYSYDTYTPYLPTSLTGSFIWRKEFWRTPAETLEDKTGDCEDMALLLASMMLNYNHDSFDVWVITITSTTPNTPGHVAVAFPVQGGQLTIVDPTGNYFTGYPWSLQSALAAPAINNWLSYWNNEIPGAFVNGVFSNDFDKQFSSTSEFLTWLSQR